LFLVASSSTPWPHRVNNQLVSLPPVGILNSLCYIWNICLFIYCTFRDGLRFLIKSISLIRQSNLLVHLANRFDCANRCDSRKGIHLKNLWSFVIMLICRDYRN